MISVYLAGPITDCNLYEANDWRNAFIGKLRAMGVRGISPLRCEPLHGERYAASYNDPRFGSPKAIGSKNFMDVQRCDLTLAYFPEAETERRVSIGTIAEVGWAFAMRKPVIIVSEHKTITEHPVLIATSSWMLPTLDDAFDTINGLFGEYRP